MELRWQGIDYMIVSIAEITGSKFELLQLHHFKVNERPPFCTAHIPLCGHLQFQ